MFPELAEAVLSLFPRGWSRPGRPDVSRTLFSRTPRPSPGRGVRLFAGCASGVSREHGLAYPARMLRRASVGLFCLVFVGCGAASATLRRAEQSYEQARYETTLSWLVDLEPDAPSLNQDQRELFFYLRGMTEYRLGHRGEALYYLAIAREISGNDRSALRREQQELMTRTLAELTPTAPLTHRPPTVTE